MSSVLRVPVSPLSSSRCLNLLEEPTDGEIIVDGLSITDKKADINKIRRHIGMVFPAVQSLSAPVRSPEYHAGSRLAEA